MRHVYISFKNDDASLAADVMRQIEDAGFQVWSDNERLRAGETWREAIDQAIRDSFALILILSPAATASDQIMYEWMFALGVGVRVIPVLLEPAELHPRLEKLDFLKLDAGAAMPWGKLIRLIQEAFDERRPAFLRRPGDRLPPFRRPDAPFLNHSNGSDNPDGISGDDINTVKRLIDALENDNRDDRVAAARRLADLGDKSAVQPLIKLLRDDDWRVRDAAAMALGKLKAASAVVALLETLRFSRPGPFGGGPNNTAVVSAIREIGALAVPVLIDALTDEDPRIRLHVIDVLGEIGDTEAVPALAGALRDAEWRVRWRAADALGKMGNETAVADLLEMLRDTNQDVRTSAAWALGQIGHASAVPGLVRLLHDREWRVRWAAAEALWEIGELAVPALVEVLHDRDEYVRRAATRALAEIGDRAIPTLTQALHDPSWEVRWSSAAALQEIGDSAVPALVEILSQADWQVSWAAAETLKRIGTPTALAAFEQWQATSGADIPEGARQDVTEE
jgi:HEAT repeat protein